MLLCALKTLPEKPNTTSSLVQEDGSFNIHAASSGICAYMDYSLCSHMACLLAHANSKQNKNQIK